MTYRFYLATAILLVANFATGPARGQSLEIPPDCGETKPWQPAGYQVQPAGQELGCLYDVLPEDAPEAGTGDILYSHGAYILVQGPAVGTFMHLVAMRMPANMSRETQLVIRADLSNFGAVDGPSACYARGETWNLDENEFHTFFELPSGTGLEDVRIAFDMTEGIAPNDLFTVRFFVYDKDMNDGIDCDAALFLDGILGDLGLITIVVANDPSGPQETPMSTTLLPAYPNPFNPSTTIAFELAQAGEATLTVFDGLGRYVSTLTSGYRNAGHNKVAFEAESLPPGVYLYRLQAGGEVHHGRVTLAK